MPRTLPAILAAAALLGTACAPATAPSPPPSPTPTYTPPLIVLPTPVPLPRPDIKPPAGAILPEHAINRFALDAFAHLRQEPGDLAFSPISIFSALAMLHAGSGGQTLDDLSRTLRLEHWDTAGLHAALADRLGALRSQLDIANGIWVNQGGELATSYRDRVDRAFAAEIASVDFASAPEEQRKLINGWISDHTNDMIPELLQEGSIRSDTAFVIANAVYFLGEWSRPFDPARTVDRAFRLGGGGTVQVPTMHYNGDAVIGDTGDVKLLQLPYHGSSLAMLVVLPGDGKTLAQVERQLTPATLQDWTRSLVHRWDVPVALPKFKIDQATDLKGMLFDLGLGSLFDRVDAARMFDGHRDLQLSGAFHQTVVDVSEKGTEAAAATALAARDVAARPSATFIADQPFLWLIRDTETGTILFMGRVADPR
jgi:serpin B